MKAIWLAGGLVSFIFWNHVVFAGTNSLSLEPAAARPGQKVLLTYKNPDKTAHDVYAHYGFNGWSLPTMGSTRGFALDESLAPFYVHQKMHYNAQLARFELALTLPAEARAIHAAFCWDACGSSDWDNNKGADYAWPVVFPYIGPILTWNEKTKPESGVVIQFEGRTEEGAAWLEYWRDGSAPQRISTSPTSGMHRFELTDLLPKTRYQYRVGAGEHFVSKTYSFATADVPEAVSREGLHFLAFGDAQDDGSSGRFTTIARSMLANNADVDFIVSTGDLPSDDHPGAWWMFFDRARDLLASKVFMPALGNHDTPTVDSNRDHTSFVHYFALPNLTQDHAYYQFIFGNAAFFGMNSERMDEFARGKQQYNWLKDRLNERRHETVNDGATWNFAYWHNPPYNVGARHWQQQHGPRAITSLFTGIVDWEFSGHEHIAQRYQPLRFADEGPRVMPTYGTQDDDGVGYLVVPGSGVTPGTDIIASDAEKQLRQTLAFPLVNSSTRKVESFLGYTRVDIKADAIDIKFFSIDPVSGVTSQKDRVSYQKN